MLHKTMQWYTEGKVSKKELAESLVCSYGKDYNWIMDMLRVTFKLPNGDIKRIIAEMKNLK